MPKGQLSRAGLGKLWMHSLSSLLFRCFSSLTNIHTQLHSVGFINLYQFIFPRRFLPSTARLHRSTTRPLERPTSHIKVTRPPCLFWLLPWENVNRPATLIHYKNGRAAFNSGRVISVAASLPNNKANQLHCWSTI